MFNEVEHVNYIMGRAKIKDRVQFIRDKGISLVFDKMLNVTFNRNLQMINSIECQKFWAIYF